VTTGDWLTLGVLALVVVALWFGRRKGRAQLSAALAAAHSAGYGEGHAAASAVSNSAAVVNIGHGAGSRGIDHRATDYHYDFDGCTDHDHDGVFDTVRQLDSVRGGLGRGDADSGRVDRLRNGEGREWHPSNGDRDSGSRPAVAVPVHRTPARPPSVRAAGDD